MTPSVAITFEDLREFLRRYRAALAPLADVCVWASALLAMTALRHDLDPRTIFTRGVFEAVVVVCISQLAIGYATTLYRVRWKNASFEEVMALATTIANVTTLLIVTNAALLHHPLPVSSIVAAGAFTFVGAGGLRGGWRMVDEYHMQPPASTKRAIVFGAGEGGEQVIDVLRRSHPAPFVAVALLDDDPAKRNLQLRHLRVSGGRDQIVEVARQVKADTLIVAIATASSGLIRDLGHRAAAAGLELRVLPPPAELLPNPSVTITDIRAVTETDLLGRHEIQTDVDSIAGYLTGRRVLVTGAGGSIGSELCRQVWRYAPASLVMLDRDESGLHQLQLSIEGRALLDRRELVVCDIRDLGALLAVFDEHRPEVVFHAAALKHLPLLEMWPAEAVRTNVFGTFNVLKASRHSGVSSGTRSTRQLPQRPFRQCPGEPRIGAVGVPRPDRSRRTRHRDPSRCDSVLHDRARGGAARHPSRCDRCQWRSARTRHGQPRAHRRGRPAPRRRGGPIDRDRLHGAASR